MQQNGSLVRGLSGPCSHPRSGGAPASSSALVHNGHTTAAQTVRHRQTHTHTHTTYMDSAAQHTAHGSSTATQQQTQQQTAADSSTAREGRLCSSAAAAWTGWFSAIEKGSSVMLLTRVPVPQHFMLEVATSHRLTPSLHTYCSRLLTREGGACTWSRQPSRSKLPRPVVTRSLRSRRR